mmetsp:Transcript_116254/g.333861  ORF Transcript_116254/g.333861 Transcript_116254/m.333861 type:complete len:221 (+) Transcript_116254:1333-1995(+)
MRSGDRHSSNAFRQSLALWPLRGCLGSLMQANALRLRCFSTKSFCSLVPHILSIFLTIFRRASTFSSTYSLSCAASKCNRSISSVRCSPEGFNPAAPALLPSADVKSRTRDSSAVAASSYQAETLLSSACTASINSWRIRSWFSSRRPASRFVPGDGNCGDEVPSDKARCMAEIIWASSFFFTFNCSSIRLSLPYLTYLSLHAGTLRSSIWRSQATMPDA